VATLTVWKFPTPAGAEQAEQTALSLQKQQLITVHDAATVSWEEGKRKPKTRQANNLTGAGALGGSFWGLLFGLIFFVPILGLAIGAGMGALAGSMSDAGIDDRFIKGSAIRSRRGRRRCSSSPRTRCRTRCGTPSPGSRLS
jgi:uncharacterized membrane protein